MFYVIYETANKLTGQKYRGCHATENLDDAYLGSGVHFKRAVKKYGRENFERTILLVCKTLEEMIEQEALYVNEEWVADPNTYNLQTGGLNYGILGERSKVKLAASVSRAHQEGRFDYSILKGREPWNKGQIKPYSNETLALMSAAKKDYKPWNAGLTGVQKAWNKGKTFENLWSDESRTKLSKTLRQKYAENGHHLAGVDPWNKGKSTGPSPHKGKTLEKKHKCLTCGYDGANLGNMRRWHFDNCSIYTTLADDGDGDQLEIHDTDRENWNILQNLIRTGMFIPDPAEPLWSRYVKLIEMRNAK